MSVSPLLHLQFPPSNETRNPHCAKFNVRFSPPEGFCSHQRNRLSSVLHAWRLHSSPSFPENKPKPRIYPGTRQVHQKIECPSLVYLLSPSLYSIYLSPSVNVHLIHFSLSPPSSSFLKYSEFFVTKMPHGLLPFSLNWREMQILGSIDVFLMRRVKWSESIIKKWWL